jgi:hypothetical protein
MYLSIYTGYLIITIPEPPDEEELAYPPPPPPPVFAVPFGLGLLLLVSV